MKYPVNLTIRAVIHLSIDPKDADVLESAANGEPITLPTPFDVREEMRSKVADKVAEMVLRDAFVGEYFGVDSWIDYHEVTLNEEQP